MKPILVFSVLAVALMSHTRGPVAPAGLVFPAGSDVPAQGGLQASITRGKLVYQQQCLACHQPDGSGVPNMNPPLAQTKGIQGDKNALIKIVLFGLKGVAIDGDSYNGTMAPHPELTDIQIADVLTYIRKSFGNKAGAVTPAQVKAIRAAK
jgi:mono/diheme cytochrome c family protein